jgi:drug/metabolite transporter (DMT)-like permease
MTRASSAVHDAASESPEGRKAPETSASIHAALILVQIAFGSLAVEGNVVMSPRFGVAPEALAMARILGGALVFVPAYLVAVARGGAGRISSWRDRMILAALSLFGVVLNQALFLRGLSQTSPVAATLLVATIPVFTAVIVVLTGRDRLRARAALGVLLAIAGIAVLSGFALPARGDALVLLNALSYAIYVVYSKDALARHGSLAVMAYVFGWGALLFAPIGGVRLLVDAPTWSVGAIGLVLYVVLVPTVLAYGLSAWALRRASPTLVTIYIYLQPIVVVALAAIQLGQVPTIRALLGGVFILAGVTIVARMKAPSKVLR